jgi:hypothetical protein
VEPVHGQQRRVLHHLSARAGELQRLTGDDSGRVAVPDEAHLIFGEVNRDYC